MYVRRKVYGKLGLNNMNLYFQNANTSSQVYSWYEWTFKVGDPIIFLDTKPLKERNPIVNLHFQKHM